MVTWIERYETLAWWLASISMVMFVLTLVLVPIVIIRIPQDYFVIEHAGSRFAARHPLLRTLWRTLRHVIGIILIVIGVLMLVLPGQGVLTILLGIMLLDFPGRHRLQYWMVSRPRVLRSINWLRQRSGKMPLQTRPEAE